MRLPLAQIRFHDCHVGWIHFTLDVGNQSTDIAASTHYDPFPNLIRWLQRIVTGHRRCVFTIDMEGAAAEFVAADRGHGRMFLLVRSPINVIPPRIRAVVDRRQFVDSVYTGFTSFAKSELYVEEEWVRISVGDRLARATPSLTPEQILATAARVDRENPLQGTLQCCPFLQGQLRGRKDPGRGIPPLVEVRAPP